MRDPVLVTGAAGFIGFMWPSACCPCDERSLAWTTSTTITIRG
jgi:hypothetical protein